MSSKQPPVHGLVVGITGRRPGLFIVFANISVTGTDNAEQSFFEQWLEIEVLEPLTLLSPSRLLMPFGSHAMIETSLDNTDVAVSYSVLPDANLITVSSRGVISALPVPKTRDKGVSPFPSLCALRNPFK